MKAIIIAFICQMMASITFSQSVNSSLKEPNGIKLLNGQTIVIESTSTIEASLAMGMELKSSTSSINHLDVKNSTDKNYSISNTMTKLKLNMNMMGQSNNYDSDYKESNSGEMTKIFDDKLNKPVDIIIDRATGMPISDNKMAKKKDADETNPAADLMKIFSNNSDDAIVSGAFELIPRDKKIGDSWADTVASKDLKVIRNFILKSIIGNEAVIELNIASTSVNKLDFQETEFEIKSETKTTSEIVTDVSTGLTKKRTSKSNITGSIQMMGQDMLISATTSSTSMYK